MTQKGLRVGLGYDIHRLVKGRPLILGGVPIPHSTGLAGHSDADVLSHAVCDALLGAAGEGDLGTQFPDRDPRWKGVSSLHFLRRALSLLKKRGMRVVNLDAVVVAEAPKIAPSRDRIRVSLARTLGVPKARVNVKGKTAEGLGPVGARKAIAAWAVVLLRA